MTFAVYVGTQADHVLDPKVAFVSLSLFNILRVPLSLLPAAVSSILMVSSFVLQLHTLFQKYKCEVSCDDLR